MAAPQKQLPKVPPFFEPKTQPRRNSVDTRGMISLATMLVSLASLSVSMLGAARVLFDVFDDGLYVAIKGLPVKVIVIAFSYVFGWVVGLVCIRGFNNLFYPVIIKIYAWGALAAVGILYIKIIQKLYGQQYDWGRFWAYMIMLLGGMFVVISLHLLLEGHDLRPFAIPPLIISVLHLFIIVYRYVFVEDPNGLLLPADLTIFIMMISISGMMLIHIGILSPLRDWITGIFERNENLIETANGHGNGNGSGNGVK